MNIVKTGDGRFIEVQGTAEAMPFGREALDALLDLADIGIRQLIEKQRAIVGHRPAARMLQKRPYPEHLPAACDRGTPAAPAPRWLTAALRRRPRPACSPNGG